MATESSSLIESSGQQAGNTSAQLGASNPRPPIFFNGPRFKILFVFVLVIFVVALVCAVAISTYSMVGLQADNEALSGILQSNKTPLTDNDWKKVREVIINKITKDINKIVPQKLEETNDTVAQLGEAVTAFNESQNVIETKIVQANLSFPSIKQKVGVIDAKTEIFNQSVEDVNRDLQHLIDIKVEEILPGIEDLGNSFTLLEGEIVDFQRKQSKTESEIWYINSTVIVVRQEVGEIEIKTNKLNESLQVTQENLTKLKNLVHHYHGNAIGLKSTNIVIYITIILTFSLVF